MHGPTPTLLPCLQVWEVATQLPVLELHSKSVTKESWPLVQWTAGDAAAYHMVTNTVHIYSRNDGFKGGWAMEATISAVMILLHAYSSYGWGRSGRAGNGPVAGAVTVEVAALAAVKLTWPWCQ